MDTPKRYKIIIEYDGTKLIGWQRQKLGVSIQGLIEESLYLTTHERVSVYGAGRTDAGVHAKKQVAHFDLHKNISCYKIQSALNHFLKVHLVSILSVEEVSPNFHARFQAVERSYIYKIINRAAPLALMKNKAWHVVKPLNVQNMQNAAQYLIGTHDLSSFRAAHCQANHAIKTINRLEIIKSGEEINIYITAPSFLYNQVRIIVGTLVKIGKEEWGVEKMKQILIAKDRTKAGPTAPAHGLYFDEVKYFL